MTSERLETLLMVYIYNEINRKGFVNRKDLEKFEVENGVDFDQIKVALDDFKERNFVKISIRQKPNSDYFSLLIDKINAEGLHFLNSRVQETQ
ncbi:hypothetical protein R4Y45_06780 [Holzapfeliella sp. He02]|uniref:Uncharacterized protein n=1 Tax=Holzapfeliella saturejae TaxID=3082953 RepID=A0ABU8SHR7_9LACO